MKWESRPWQDHALDWLTLQDKSALWMQMGLGKTVVAASHILQRMDMGHVNRCLVVGPVRVIESVWPSELRKWDHLAGLPFRLVRGSMKHRAAMLAEPWHGIELLSYETLTWCIRDWGRKRKLPWQMVVFDEVSKLKSPSTQRFRALRHRCQDFHYVLELTGSPAPQGLENVWAPIYLMDQGQRLGRVYSYNGGGFMARWFRPSPTGFGFEPTPSAHREIHEAVADITLAMRAEDYIDLPPLIVNDVWVDLPRDALALHAEMEKEMFVRLASGSAIEIANGGVLTGKCRQLANGAMYVERTTNWEAVHDAKLKALDEVDEEAGGPLLVAYQFRSDLERLQKRYPWARTLERGRPETVEKWNAGKIPMLLIHPASAGHGLNLQHGGDTLVFMGCGYSYDQYEQTVARLAGGLRRERPVFVHRIVGRRTIDEAVLEALEGRCDVQTVLMKRLARQNLPTEACG